MPKPNTIESLTPFSGRYSLLTDMRLNAWLAVATLVYLAGLFLLKRNLEWSPLAKSAIALAPLVPGMFYVRSWFRFIRGMDELQQRVQLEAFLFVALGTVLIAIVINTMNANGLVLGFVADGLSIGGACVVMLALWPIGLKLANRRFK